MEKHILYHEGDWDVDIVVRSARNIDGTRRDIWQSEAVNHKTGDQVQDYFRSVLHPDLCAPLAPQSRLVVEEKVYTMPLEFEAFTNLPEMPADLFAQWWDAVYECNPHWRNMPDAEKKENNPTEPISD